MPNLPISIRLHDKYQFYSSYLVHKFRNFYRDHSMALWIVVFGIVSPLIVFLIAFFINCSYFNSQSAPWMLIIDSFWSSSNNARYILSALSQAQAAIFGIFFSLGFIIIQLQIQNKAVSPKMMKKVMMWWFKSPMLIIIFVVYVVSISGDLILLRYAAKGVAVNLFCAISLAVFAILLLIPYTYFNIIYFYNIIIKEEIRDGQARRNLSGIDLSNDVFPPGIDLKRRILTRANLRDVFLERSHLEGAYLVAAHMEGAHLLGAHMEGAQLQGAHMEGVYLMKADLMGAALVGAELKGAHLDGARLMWAELCRANLEGANLEGANLKMVRYNDVTLESLLKAKNLDKAILDDELREALDKLKALPSGSEAEGEDETIGSG